MDGGTHMTSRRLVILPAALLMMLSTAGSTLGDVRRNTSERRPYIVEVGEPHAISRAALRREASHISQLAEHLALYGYPDYAEIQEVRPDWPWESSEVHP